MSRNCPLRDADPETDPPGDIVDPPSEVATDRSAGEATEATSDPPATLESAQGPVPASGAPVGAN